MNRGNDEGSTSKNPVVIPTDTIGRSSSFEGGHSPPRPDLNRAISEPALVVKPSRASLLLQETLNRDSLQRIHIAGNIRAGPRSPISPPTSPYFHLPPPLPTITQDHASTSNPKPYDTQDQDPGLSPEFSTSSYYIPSVRSRENLPSNVNPHFSPPPVQEQAPSTSEFKATRQLHWIEQLRSKVEGESDSSDGMSIEIPIEFVPPRTSSHNFQTAPLPINQGIEEVEVLRGVEGEEEESRGRPVSREALTYRFPDIESSKSSSRNRTRITPTRTTSKNTTTTTTIPTINRLPVDNPQIYPTGFNFTQRRQSTPNPINVTREPVNLPNLQRRRTSLAPPLPVPVSPFVAPRNPFEFEEVQKTSPRPVVGFDYPGRVITPSNTEVLGSIRNTTPPLAAAFLSTSRPSSEGSSATRAVETMAQKEEREKMMSEFFMNESRSRGRNRERRTSGQGVGLGLEIGATKPGFEDSK